MPTLVGRVVCLRVMLKRMTFSRQRKFLIWVALILGALVWAMYSLNVTAEPQLRQELILRHISVMLVLSFPLGFVSGGFLWWLVVLVNLRPSGEFAEVLVIWVTLVISSYMQWFLVAPGLWRRLKGKTV